MFFIIKKICIWGQSVILHKQPYENSVKHNLLEIQIYTGEFINNMYKNTNYY